MPDYQILDMTKLKAFANDKLNIDKMTISLLDRVGKKEKNEGKGENAVTSIFSFFLSVFFKAVLFRVVKSRDCVVKKRIFEGHGFVDRN